MVRFIYWHFAGLRYAKHEHFPLYLDISCRPSCTYPFYCSSFDHCTKDGFDSRRADIGENLANVSFGKRGQAVQDGRFHTGFFSDLLAVYHCKPLVQFLNRWIGRFQQASEALYHRSGAAF